MLTSAEQFDGFGLAPIALEVQTALEISVADATPKLFTCGIVRINTTADNLRGVVTMAVVTAHPAGHFKPQVFSCTLFAHRAQSACLIFSGSAGFGAWSVLAN